MTDDQRQTILVVDDEPANIQALGNLLKDEYHIRVANSGEKALALIQDSSQPNPDLILLDIRMPGIDGYEVCRRLKADPGSDIPVIFVTALDSASEEERGLELGAVDYIAKPFNQAIVRARVHTHMSLRRKTELMEQRQAALHRLQEITDARDDSVEDKIEALFRLGAEFFGLPYAILSRVEGEDYWVQQARSPDGALYPGQHFALGTTYCTHTLTADGPMGFSHAGKSAIADHPCYRTQGMEAYIGTPIRVEGRVYGTLNFSAPEPRTEFSDFDWRLLELMGHWVSGALTRAGYRRALERERELFIGGPTVAFVWRYEDGWPVDYVSPNLAENFGHDPASIKDRAFTELVHPEDVDRVGQAVEHYLSEAVPSFQQEYRLRTRGGDYRWVYDFTVPRRNEEGVVETLHGYLLDRSSEHELRGALEASNAELEQFAYAISHDLKEPLRSVSGYLSLLRRRFGDQLPEKAAGYVAAAEEGGSRMGRMIEDLLDYSRIKRMGDELAPVALDEVLEEVLANLASAREQTGASIEADPLPTVVGDRGQLVRLFQNLLGNALKYRRAEVPPVISIRLEEGQRAWQVAVADNGIGIDPDQADRVFQVFQRLHSREAYEGTGAGMALAQRIVQRHGGTIWVDSAGEDCGSTFRFTLPWAEEGP